MTTTTTHWQRHGARGARVVIVEAVPEEGIVRIRLASAPDSHGWIAMLDPKTGGPRGYSKCEEVTT